MPATRDEDDKKSGAVKKADVVPPPPLSNVDDAASCDDASEAAAPPLKRPASIKRRTEKMIPDETILAPEETRRITELYEKLNRVDHYALLGVSATDDVKTIKRAFFAHTKEFHPDRWFRKNIGPLKSKVEAITAALSAAESTLADAKKRAAYDEYLREGLKTRIHRRQAEGLEAQKKWPAAAEAWGRIVERRPTDAFVQHRYAHALVRAGVDFAAAQSAAMRAIELDTTRAEYRVTAALVHLAEDRDRSALAQLAIACEIEPDRADIAALHAALSAKVSRVR